MRKAITVALLLAISSTASAQMSLPGSFEVSETGAAVYTIPIAVPPGTAGLEPKLTLQYNSRAGNGLLGVGWTLGGLPSIVRCPKTITQDGARGGINYDNNDRFCLEGERLVAINGTYGADGTEYRTEREGFSKIVSYGSAGTGPAWFKVWTKAGQVLEFGNTTDSRIEAQGKTTARLWAVNKVSDTAGNYFSVAYAEDNVNGEYRPTRIDYTGNASASIAPYASVRFVYETRPATDQTPLYEAGSLIKTTQRLTKLLTYTGESLVREYRLAYEQSASTQRSRLIAITPCEGSGACLPATTADFANDGSQFTITSTAGGLNGQYAAWNFVADVNGDGRTDIVNRIPPYEGGTDSQLRVQLSTGTGLNIQTWLGNLSGVSYDTTWVGDFNGDGRSDLAHRISGSTVRLHLSTGSAFTVQEWSCSINAPTQYIWIGDYNGDGRTDIASIIDGNRFNICLSTGAGFTQAEWAAAPNYIGGFMWVGDFNGDGRTDIAGYYDGTGGTVIRVHLSTGSGFSIQDWTSALNFNAGWSWAGDFNGDGKTDVAGYLDGTGGTVIRVHLSTGTGFVIQDWTSSLNATLGYIWPGDFNGDGKTDIAAAVDGTNGTVTRLHLSKGNGFVVESWTTELLVGTQQIGWNLIGDFNGDGKLDIASTRDNGATVRLHTGNGPFADQLTSLANGVGAITNVVQAPLSQTGTLYTKETNAVYPIVDVQGPVYVVSEVQSANGVGGTYHTTYRYAGAKADQQGRGFLGFRQVIAKDEQTLVEQATEYLQAWPFVGLTAKRTKTLATVELNRTENTYAADDLGSGRKFVKLTQSVESSREITGTALPTVTTSYQYDTYGNATNVAVSTGDGHSKTTVNTYANDLANWLLGRLTRAEVTAVTP